MLSLIKSIFAFEGRTILPHCRISFHCQPYWNWDWVDWWPDHLWPDYVVWLYFLRPMSLFAMNDACIFNWVWSVRSIICWVLPFSIGSLYCRSSIVILRGFSFFSSLLSPSRTSIFMACDISEGDQTIADRARLCSSSTHLLVSCKLNVSKLIFAEFACDRSSRALRFVLGQLWWLKFLLA